MNIPAAWKKYPNLLIRKYSLKGNSLYLVVFISFILSVMLMMLIANNYYNQVEVLHYSQLKNTIDKTNSNIQYQLLSLSSNSDSIPNLADTLYPEIQSYTTTEQWGGFSLISSNSQWKDLHYKKIGLAGAYLFAAGQVGLYLADQGKYLSIAGKTRLGGVCYLPALGLRSVYIDGKAYKGNRLLYGEEKTSEKDLPELNQTLVEWLSDALNWDQLLIDSVGNNYDFGKKDSIVHAFDKKAVLYELSGNAILENISLKGKIIVRSDSLMVVRNTCHTENVILIAPTIIIEKEFIGSLQAVARDSILIEEGVQLTYPSAVIVYNNRSQNAFCYVSPFAEIKGGIICASYLQESSNAELFVREDSKIDGIVYCNGGIQYTGQVAGSLYTKRFTLKTPRGFYENHLLDAVIDPMDQYQNFIVPAVFTSTKSFGIAEWVYCE